MTRAILTGATGMIGVHLVRELLDQGWEVTALVRPGSPHIARLEPHPHLSLIDCGLDRLDSCPLSGRYDAFFHLGWSGTSPALRSDPEAQAVNIGCTLAAVRLAHRLGCSVFVGAGSQAEYGPRYELPISPETPAAPVTAYGICKLAAGSLARLECQRLGLHCAWVRIFSVYGRYDLPTTLVSTALQKLAAGETPSFTPATHIWDYLEAGDAARALRLAAERTSGCRIYCLGSGEARPLRDYIEQLRDIAAPGAALDIGAIPYAGQPAQLQADISALTRDTGWRPLVSFAEGIRRLVRNP